MSIPFHPVSIEDKEQIQSYTLPSDYRTCDFSFGNLYNWSCLYGTEVAFHKDMLVVRFTSGEVGRTAYLMPVGSGPLEEVLQDMEEDAAGRDHPLLLMAVPQEGVDVLKKTYPESLHLLSDRDYHDYIYLREKLVSLSGKKLQSKRNFVNRFRKNFPDFIYEEITEENVEECIRVENEWFSGSSRTSDISAERKMVMTALRGRERIGLMGGCIRINGEIIAFSMGMPINHDTFGVHIEKANTDIMGSFAIINQEFASRIPEQYIYVNREEDLGIEGLRNAKMSYRPEMLLEKFTVMLRNE